MKHFDIFGIFSGIIGTFFAVIFVENIYLRIIITLSVLLVLLIIKIVLLSKENKQLRSELSELQIRHKELSRQYSYKKNKLDYTEAYWSSLNIVFLNALQRSKENRFEQAYKLYLIYNHLKNHYEGEL